MIMLIYHQCCELMRHSFKHWSLFLAHHKLELWLQKGH